MNNRYGRIELLLSQHRYEMAERDLRSMLAAEPRDATAHALLAMCVLHHPDRVTEATEIAEQAVGLAPDEPLSHYALAVSYLQRGRPQQAEEAIRESIRLDPHDAAAFAVLGQAQLASSRFRESLESANQGLAVDPDHLGCLNIRSMSLERLGRSDEAIEAAGQTLRRDPDDSMSHAAHGLTLLNAGRHREAQVAFREALRLDPQNEMARIGLIDALNNRSLVFRGVYKFYVSLSRLNAKAALALIFGAWLLVQVLNNVVVPAVPALAPLIQPIVLLYVMFVILTWIANPLFNTFLRFHPFGQHLLDRSQRWASNLIAPSLALSLFGFICGVTVGNATLALLAAAYWLGLAIPISGTFMMATVERKALFGAAAVVVALLPVYGVTRSVWVQDSTPMYAGFQYFAFGLLAFQVAGNLIAAKPVQH